ncbi:MAG: CRISPR-associated primase-polymerase type A1 [Desulfamplus sp.]
MQPNLSIKNSYEADEAVQPLKTDYSLLLKRVKDSFLHSESESFEKATTDARAILKNSNVWKTLAPEQMAEWAALSQMAGEIVLALEIYSYLTITFPEFEKGRIEYLELLSFLNKKEEFQSSSKDYAVAFDNSASSPLHPASPDSAASLPFEGMIRKRQLMEHFLNLFSGRENVFARQWADKNENKAGYVPVKYAMTLAHVEEHLNGFKTYGIYLLKSDSKVKCGVIDADINIEYRQGKITAEQKNTLYREKSWMISRIFENSKQLGITPLLEYSGHKGYHFWYFFSQPVDASKVKALLTRIAEPVNRDISSFDLEVFPKQDRLTEKGLGNLVKLPLGIHRKNGKPSFFMECEKRDIESQLDFLRKVELIDPQILDGVNCAAIHPINRQKSDKIQKNEQIILHPRMASIAKDYPELYELERLCPPVGQVIAICREGKNLSMREEKVLFQTIGFLPRAKLLMHHLMASCSEYNPHMVDFKISKITGTPLGCKKIHSLLGFTGDYCPLEPDSIGYLHPLIHLEAWKDIAEKKSPKSMRIENLQDALENMKAAIIQLQRFMA